MSAIDFRQLRAQVSMAEVLGLLGYQARSRKGQQLRGPCPLHGSAASSRVFSVHLGKQLFHCFKCGAGGNHLDLWSRATGQPLYQAALELCRRLNRSVPWLNPEQRSGTRTETSKPRATSPADKTAKSETALAVTGGGG